MFPQWHDDCTSYFRWHCCKINDLDKFQKCVWKMAKDFLTRWHENAHNIIINYDFLNTSKRLQKTQSQSKVQCQNQEKQKKRHLFCMHAKLCSHRSSVFHSLLIKLNYIYINRSKTMQQYSNNTATTKKRTNRWNTRRGSAPTRLIIKYKNSHEKT